MSFNKIIYREWLVKHYCIELGILAAECTSKEEFDKESLVFVNSLFTRIDLEASEYYQICKRRAQLLDSLRWVND